MAYKSSPRGSRPVSLVALHSAEGARTARSLGAFFWKPETQASSHVGIDAHETMNYVGYDRAAWTLRSGNPISDNAEMCAFARWTRAQWMSTGVVDGCVNPLAMLKNTAAWVRSRCLARDIPMVKLSPAQVAAGHRGVIAHWDWTIGKRDGSHTDPGSGFPWDYVMDLARGGAQPGPGPTPPAPIAQSGVELMERKLIKASMTTTNARLLLPGGPNCRIVVRPPNEGDGGYPVWQNHIYAWASAPGNERVGIGAHYDPMNIAGYDLSIAWTREIPLPGALWADYHYSCAKDFYVDILG